MSNVVWQWHQLNGWPLPATTNNEWAAAAVAHGKEEEEACLGMVAGRVNRQQLNIVHISHLPL